MAFASSRLSEYGYCITSHPNVRQGRVVRSCTVSTYAGSNHVKSPATECLHAHARVARMSWLYGSDPRTPIACRWCLYSIRRAAFRTAFPRVSSWCDAERGDSLLEFHAHRWCVHAWGVARARHSRVSLRNGPLRAIPDSLRSPQGFEMRVTRAPSPFLDGRKSGHIHPTPTFD